MNAHIGRFREGNMNLLSLCLLWIPFAETPPTLLLRVVNTAHIPGDVLARAEIQVKRIYRQAGISIDWRVESIDDGARQLSVAPNVFRAVVVIVANCVNAQTCLNKSSTGTAFGSEGKGTPWAYVFADRLYEMAGKFQKRTPVPGSEGLVLGHIIAHEVGHLLLPPGHSFSGLMAAELNEASIRDAVRGDLTFTPEQGEFMRTVLSMYSRAP
jgi:hypothetical protein